MGNICENCKLNCQLKDYKRNLNNLIVEKKMNLLDDEVIELSQEVDKLLHRCMFCQRYRNLLRKRVLIYNYIENYYINHKIM